ncbi:MAG: hypothetical protein WDW36_004517 [Sanguina aurantia]
MKTSKAAAETKAQKAAKPPAAAPAKAATSHLWIFTLAVPALLFAYMISTSLRDVRPTLKGQQSSSTPLPHLETALTPRQRAMSDKGEKTVVGNTTYHPSFGLFPKGCKWRTVTTEGSDDVGYQYFDFARKRWSDARPVACLPVLHPAPGPEDWKWHQGSPRTEVGCETSHCMYTNLYYNNGRWYALVDGTLHIPSWRFSRNQEIVTMHVADVAAFTNSVKWDLIKGDTILFDFIFFIHPTAIGHWWEMLGPLYSILKTAAFKRPATQFILLHLRRQHLLEWVRAMVAVTLGVPLDEHLPPVLMQEETDSAWQQISECGRHPRRGGRPVSTHPCYPLTSNVMRFARPQPTQMLEGFKRDTWYIFERVLIVKDLYTGGGRTFHSREDAREFRGLIYEQYGLPPPEPRPTVPHIITFQRKSANRRIINEAAFIDLLKTYGELRVVEYGSSSSLYEQLLTMHATGVFISVHTSNLANAPLLQPGSGVFEVIQRNWMWNGLDTSFRDQTAMMGDIHHFAWRAVHLNQTVYLKPRDLLKIGHWPTGECGTEECVEAHTSVDVIVDIPEFKKLLDSRLPFIWNNSWVSDAELPWPEWDVDKIWASKVAEAEAEAGAGAAAAVTAGAV